MEYGRITDRCGYVDRASRTIVLNRDATDDELEAELIDDLVILLEDRDGSARIPVPEQRPALELVHSNPSTETAEPGRRAVE